MSKNAGGPVSNRVIINMHSANQHIEIFPTGCTYRVPANEKTIEVVVNSPGVSQKKMAEMIANAIGAMV